MIWDNFSILGVKTSRRLVLSTFSDFSLFILSGVVCSLEHDLRSTMSSRKPRKTKQKSILSWVKPQDTKARVEDENVEESCAAEIPEGSSESGQDYAVVVVVGSQLPLLGDGTNQPRNFSFPSKSYGNRHLPALNHGRGQAQPLHASACPQGIGRWY